MHSPGQYIDPAPNIPEHAQDVIAYPALEKLFHEMDYCECEHCRSILSPAAYLVDLLQFLERDKDRWTAIIADWRKDHGDVPYPFSDLAAWTAAGKLAELTPLDVLLSRRPDLQHLPLTCENTNTPLPYIDLVNETLEHYVAQPLTFSGYTGHKYGSKRHAGRIDGQPAVRKRESLRDAGGHTLSLSPAVPSGFGGPPPLL